MIDKQFKKEAFKESVKENVKFLICFVETLDTAVQPAMCQSQ